MLSILTEITTTSNKPSTGLKMNNPKEVNNDGKNEFDQKLNINIEIINNINSSENINKHRNENTIDSITSENYSDMSKIINDKEIKVSDDLNYIINTTDQLRQLDSTLIEFAKTQGFDNEAISLLFSKSQDTEINTDGLKSEAAINNINSSNNLLLQLTQPPTTFLNTNIDKTRNKDYSEIFSINKYNNPTCNILMQSSIDEISPNIELFNKEPINYMMENIGFNSDSALSTSLISNDSFRNKLNEIHKINNNTETTNSVDQYNSIERNNNISQKIGIAIGKQLINEINNENWEVQIQLNPKELGRIEINLKLHEHRMDAQFFVENSYTKMLLHDGMAKLKETVGFSGIELASTWIENSDSGQKQHNSREHGNQQWQLTNNKEREKLQDLKGKNDEIIQPTNRIKINNRKLVDLYI